MVDYNEFRSKMLEVAAVLQKTTTDVSFEDSKGRSEQHKFLLKYTNEEFDKIEISYADGDKTAKFVENYKQDRVDIDTLAAWADIKIEYEIAADLAKAKYLAVWQKYADAAPTKAEKEAAKLAEDSKKKVGTRAPTTLGYEPAMGGYLTDQIPGEPRYIVPNIFTSFSEHMKRLRKIWE